MITYTGSQSRNAAAASSVTGRGVLLQRKCACGGSSGLSGECEECRKKKMQGIQTKLAIGEPDDAYEREADRIADQVLATPSRPATRDAPPRIQRFAGQPIGQAETAPASVDRTLADSGRSLEPTLRQNMEQRFGYDFSRVRVHTGADAEHSAREVNALAYTVGRDVVFGAGRFAPETREGRRLLAHELTHVVQQSASDSTPISQNDGMPSGPARPAREFTATVGSGRTLQRKGRTAGGFFANLFQSWDYSEETLKGYLKVLDDTKDIEDDDDSDDKARQVVRDWKSGASKFNLTQERKALLIREMLSGAVLGSDQEGILVLLNSANSSELSYFFGPGRLRHQTLLDEFGVHKKALLAFYRGRFGVAGEKEIVKNPEPMQQPKEKPRGPELSYDEALAEGAEVLSKAGFGKVCGTSLGPDEGDGYDAREWKETGVEKLVATVEPWLAFQHLLQNLGKEVPSATGGKTRWTFDCYGATVANSIYADWRTLTREEFNRKHRPLELGIDSRINKRWESQGVITTKPGERPFTYEMGHQEQGVAEVASKKVLNKSIKQLLDEAPIGSKVVWTNLEVLNRCNKNGWQPARLCNYANENAQKLGPDKYYAHPFGKVSESDIKRKMAEEVMEGKPVPKGYIEKNIFVSSIRRPTQQKPETI